MTPLKAARRLFVRFNAGHRGGFLAIGVGAAAAGLYREIKEDEVADDGNDVE